MAKAKETRYILKVVPHKKQRYETPGDWIPGRPARMIASRLNNADFEFLVLFHELIEHELCKKRGIKDREVVAFDKIFEKNREKGLNGHSEEPGDDPRSPYRREHKFALKLERLMAKQLGVNWKEYNTTLFSIRKKKHLAYRG